MSTAVANRTLMPILEFTATPQCSERQVRVES